MEIIDSHMHIGDIYRGFPIKYPLKQVPFGLISINEFLGYDPPFSYRKSNNAGESNTANEGRLLGDIAYMESSKRVQVSEPEVYIKTFQQNGVSKGILLPIEPNVKTTYVLELAKKHEEFIAFASVDFEFDDFIEKLHSHIKAGCKGLKIHHVIQDIQADDQRIFNLLEEFKQYNLPVCLHAGPSRNGITKIDAEEYAYPSKLVKTVESFPTIPFIFAHMGLGFSDEVIELAKKHPNIHLDTSFQPYRQIEKAIKEVGCERVLYGSDFPLVKQETTLKIIQKGLKDTSALKRVLAENIKELIRLS